MTRSTLLRTVQRVAGVAAGPRSLSAESRRHFLVAGGALALAAATSRANAASRRRQPKVGIVGAGLAGLAAAHTLRKAGLHATVIEGSTRIGGRCWSERGTFADGQVAERGGEFVDSVHEELIALVRELHLELDDVLEATPAGTDAYTLFDGTRYTVAEATHDYEALFPVVQQQAKALGDAYGYVGSNRAARSLDAISMAQWIDKYVPGGRTSRFGRLLANAFAEEFAVEVGQLSAINLVLALAPCRAMRSRRMRLPTSAITCVAAMTRWLIVWRDCCRRRSKRARP